MSVTDAAVVGLHLVFGATWVGTVAFMALAVLPLAAAGELERGALSTLVGRTVWISRLGAAAMFLTGTHMMATMDYVDTEVLLENRYGQAVLAMIVLWLALIGIVEVASRRIRSGLDANLLREPARDGRTWFLVATAVGVLLFLDGAAITTGAL